MKVDKPNWTPIELYKQMLRWSELNHLTERHDAECDCNLCFELFALDNYLPLFTEDEKAGAVIEASKLFNESKGGI